MLEELSKNDKNWRKMAFYICQCKSLADDLVNDMYIKLYEKHTPDKQYNEYYVYRTIKSLFIDHVRKTKTISLDSFLNLDLISDLNDVLKERESIANALDKLNVVDREVLYLTSENSLRECERIFNELPYGNADYQWFHYRRKKALKKLKDLL